MLNYILKAIKKHFKLFIFMIIGFFTIETIVPVALSALYTSRAVIKDDISKYSRGQYDILVRNEKSISETEKKLGLVEENYLASGNGGITIEQYEKIKNLAGVDIAAPVSTLGYFASDHNVLMTHFNITRSFHMRIDSITYDGANEYIISSNDYYQLPTDRPSEYLRNEYAFYTTDTICPQGSHEKSSYEMGIYLPSMWDMVVAIDPEEEARLTGIDKRIFKGRYLNGEDKITDKTIPGNRNLESIPIIINEGANVAFKIRIQFDDFKLDIKDSVKILKEMEGNRYGKKEMLGGCFNDEYYDKDEKGRSKKHIEALKNIPVKSSTTNTIDLSGYIKPFARSALVMTGDGVSIRRLHKGEGSFIAENGSQRYTASPIVYSLKNDELEAVAKGENNGIIIFRDVEKVGYDILETGNIEKYIGFTEIGRVKLDENQKERLSGSPLGIYGDSYVTQMENEKGEKVENKRLYATTNPGSFVPSAPHGYTTLAAATKYKGEAPIDAIRVRVLGIDSYDANAKVQIERVAKEINAITGLHVDVVAGSSTRNIIVAIPGIGKVSELWTTLGAAAEITDSWNLIGGILIITFFLCGVIFLLNRISCSISSRKKEIGILKTIGWDENKIAKVICGEVTAAAIISSIFTIITTGILKMFFKLNYIWDFALITLIIFILISVFVSYYFARFEQRKIGMIHIFKGDLERKNLTENTNIFKMIINNVLSYRKKYILLILQITLSGGLAVFTWLSIQATRNFTGYTAMGRHVNFVTDEMSNVLIIGSILIVIFTILDRFSTIVLERKNEIGILKTIGWSDIDVIALISGEAFLIAFSGALFAAVVSIGGYKLIYSSLVVSLFKIALLFLSLICVSLLSCGYPLYVAIRINPVEIILDRDLRYSIKDIFNLKVISIAVSSCIIIGLIGASSLYYIRGKKESMKKETIAMSISGGIKKDINSNNMIRDIEKLVSYGELVGENQLRAGDYIISRLEELGFNPKIDEFKVGNIIGIKEKNMKISFDKSEYEACRIYVDSENFKEGKNEIVGNTIVWGQGYSDNYNGMTIIADSAMEDAVMEDVKDLKGLKAVVFVDKEIKRDGIFKSKLSFEGVKISREESLKNIWIDIKGTNNSTKTILLTAHYGSLGKGAGDNASGVSSLIELSRILKNKPVKDNIRILFTGGGDYDFDRGFRRYIESNKAPIDSIFMVDGIGASSNIIFGNRDDDIFGKPENLHLYYAKTFEEADNLKDVSFLSGLLDKPSEFVTSKGLLTPDEMMKLGIALSDKLNLKLSPTNSYYPAGSILEASGISFSYISSKNEKLGTVEDDIKIIDGELLKKYTVFIYGLISE